MLSLVLTTGFLGITFWLVRCGYWGWLLFLVTMAILAAVAWQIARNWATISGAIATWWTANWQNAVRWIMILLSLAFAVGIIWMLVPKVPKCAPPGCYASATASSAPTASTAPATVRDSVWTIEITKAWGQWQTKDLDDEVRWDALNPGFPYEAQTESGRVYPFYAGGPFTRIGENSPRFRFRIAESSDRQVESLQIRTWSTR